MILEADRISISFGGVRAIDGVSVSIASGQVFSIIGPNGSGKTTLFNLVSGIYSPNDGNIRLAGETVTGLAPDKLARRGLSRTFQNLQIFSRMSMLENVMVGRHRHERTGILADLVHWPSVARQNRATRDAASALPMPTTVRRARSPTVLSSVSKSRALSPASRRCCCSTSRPQAAIRSKPRSSITLSVRS
jgi:branched-chain amino acid transport system ATP-binding protein